MTACHPSGSTPAAVCLALAAAGVCPAQVQAPLDLGWDQGLYALATPDAARTTAERINIDLVPVGSTAEPTTSAGYTITSDVIVIADDLVWAEGLGVAPAPLAGLSDVWSVELPTVTQAMETWQKLAARSDIRAAYLNAAAPRRARSISIMHPVLGQPAPAEDDPLFEKQWTLRNEMYPVADARITGAWAQGLTGEGVVIGLMEGPFDAGHPDLADRFHAALSLVHGWPEPPDAHSTGVAGIAAASLNGIGMVGAAPGARLASLPVGTTLETISAMLHANDRIAIKLGTWGRADRGSLSRLDPATEAALAKAAETTTIIWAAGNGGPADRMDYDALAASPFVLPVTAVGDLNLRSSFGERGAAHLISGYSSGNARSVVAPLPGREWTTRFGGTSAAAPLVAGAIALALEARPGLTPREIEHLLVSTARPIDTRSGVWTTNAAGVQHSDLHGFGAIDAAALVEEARAFEPLPPAEHWSSGEQGVDAALPPPVGSDHAHDHHDHAHCDHPPTWVEHEIQGPAGLLIEHVMLTLDITTEHVGSLHIELVSPGGTTAVFSTPRADQQDNLSSRPFLSRKHWGESAEGLWRVRIADAQPGTRAHWHSVELRFRGSAAAEAQTPAKPSAGSEP